MINKPKMLGIIGLIIAAVSLFTGSWIFILIGSLIIIVGFLWDLPQIMFVVHAKSEGDSE